MGKNTKACIDMFNTLYNINKDMKKAIKAFKSDDTNRKVSLATNEVLQNNFKQFKEVTKIKGLTDLWKEYRSLRGFYEYVKSLSVDDVKKVIGTKYKIFGEWLVPHTLKTRLIITTYSF